MDNENININYNLIEPQIFSIPKKTELKDFDNYKVINEPVINISKKPIISSGFVKQQVREYSNEPKINENKYNQYNEYNPYNSFKKTVLLLSLTISKVRQILLSSNLKYFCSPLIFFKENNVTHGL